MPDKPASTVRQSCDRCGRLFPPEELYNWWPQGQEVEAICDACLKEAKMEL